MISQNRATGLVAPGDIIELDLDSRPVDPNARTYSEVAIHSEIYKVRPDVNAVIHHHAPDSIKLEGDRGWEQSNLIHTPARGQLVARTLGASPALLLVNHGAVVVGSSIYEAVGHSIYMPVGARSTARPRLDRKRAACGASSQPRDGFNELGAERVAQHLLDLPIDLRADCHVIGCRRDHVLPENRESHPLEWLAAVCHDIADQLRRLGAGARRTSLTSPDTST